MCKDYQVKPEAEVSDSDYESRVCVCPVCGKTFYLPVYVSMVDYVYTIPIRDRKSKKTFRRKCCSYSCYRKARREAL